MLTVIAALTFFSAIGNGRWASQGGHRKSAGDCIIDAMSGVLIGCLLLSAAYG